MSASAIFFKRLHYAIAKEFPFMTLDQLASRSKKELAVLARKKGVRNWESLSKDELILALTPKRRVLVVKARSAKPKKPVKKIAKVRHQIAAARDTSHSSSPE